MSSFTLTPADREHAQHGPPLWQRLRWLPLVSIALIPAILLLIIGQGGLPAIYAWFLLQLIPPVLGLIIILASAGYAIVRRRCSRLLYATAAAALLSLLPAIQIFAPVLAYPSSLERMRPTATVRLPSNMPLTVLWGGDSLASNMHAAMPDQRWAYDLVVAPYLSGSHRLEDYGCYGVDVVAPIAGLVVDAHDGEPDMPPGVASQNVQVPEGNRVVMQLEDASYLVIAHLKPGSLRVRAGQQLQEGQVIGQCGNSGNTSEPHIHIHHQRQSPLLQPINLAEGLPLYFRDHDGSAMPQGGLRFEHGHPIATGATVRHHMQRN